mgnify:CR=1 FL=1
MDAKLSKVFEAGFSVNMSLSHTEDVCTDGTFSPYVNAFYFNPFVSPTDAEGNFIPNQVPRLHLSLTLSSPLHTTH